MKHTHRAIRLLTLAVVSEMRSILREYNQPETVADEAWSCDQSAKNSMIASLSG